MKNMKSTNLSIPPLLDVKLSFFHKLKRILIRSTWCFQVLALY